MQRNLLDDVFVDPEGPSRPPHDSATNVVARDGTQGGVNSSLHELPIGAVARYVIERGPAHCLSALVPAFHDVVKVHAKTAPDTALAAFESRVVNTVLKRFAPGLLAQSVEKYDMLIGSGVLSMQDVEAIATNPAIVEKCGDLLAALRDELAAPRSCEQEQLTEADAS